MKKKLLLIVSILLIVIGAIYFAFKGVDVGAVIADSGIYGYIIAILLTYAFMLGQVLPTAVINIATVYAFGLYGGIIISLVAVISGALLLFVLGRKYGVKIAKWVVGKDDINAWQEKLSRGKYTLFLLLLFPASPDSLLYVLAGMSKLKFKEYLIIILASKPIGIVTTCLFGGGAIIPISLEFAWLWAVLGAFMVSSLYLSVKYQDKIDTLFKKKL